MFLCDKNILIFTRYRVVRRGGTVACKLVLDELAISVNEKVTAQHLHYFAVLIAIENGVELALDDGEVMQNCPEAALSDSQKAKVLAALKKKKPGELKRLELYSEVY